MQKPKIIQAELPKFNWSAVSPESFRGPGLSFPISVELVMAPTFNVKVLGAAQSFLRYFEGSILDPEDDGFEVNLANTVKYGDTLHTLHEADLCLKMTFICGYTRMLILTVGSPTDLTTRH